GEVGRKEGMPSYKPYHREQAALLPAHVQDVLGENHLCFLVHDMVEQLDLSAFEARAALPSAPYDDGMTARLCLAGEEHAQAGATHSRRLGVSLFSGRHSPDHKTLNEFLRLHGKAVMQLFTQVLQLLRQAGVARLGEVAIDSTRIKGRASRDRVVRRTELECKVQQWMSELDEDPDRQPGREVSTGERQRVQEQLRQMRDSGEDKLSVTDADARFLRERQGFVL